MNKLSSIEKMILVNQYLILSKLSDSDCEKKKYIDNAIIIENEYECLYENIFNDCDSKEDVSIVIDILDLYEKIYLSMEKIGNKKIDKSIVKIPGFDGNNETRYLKFAKFFVENCNRFGVLYEDLKLIDYNSHYRQIEKYKKQLDIWESMNRKRELTEIDISKIFDIKLV